MSELIYRDRKNTNCLKWDACGERFGHEDLLAVWVADMDFEVPACVKEALHKYVDEGCFGYYKVPESYYDAFMTWEKERHGYEVKREWLRFSPGVVGGFNWLVDIMTEPGDGVIILTPVYYPFSNAIKNHGRKLVKCPLIKGPQGYEADYADFEAKIVENHVKLMIFCSPHNPVGKVWKREELVRIMDICKKHGVRVISDEIHHDLIMTGNEHIPTATAGDYDDMLVTVTAASKTFNLAGCQNSIVIIPDEEIRKQYDKYAQALDLSSGNPFGYIAVESAYRGGQKWLAEILETVEGNYHYLRNTLEEKLPGVEVAELQGTYLMWIDLGKYVKPEEIEKVIFEDCKMAVDFGDWFGDDAYKTYIRVNLATSRENIEEAADRLVKALLF